MKNLLFITIIFLFIACNSGNKSTDQNTEDYHYLDAVKSNTVNKAKVLEFIDVDTYTYVRLQKGDKKFWAAITSQPVEIGKTYYFGSSMRMDNFTSKQLNRTFDTIFFIQDFRDHPEPDNNNGTKQETVNNKTSSNRIQNLQLNPPEGGISLQELFSNIDQYKNKNVTVQGIVVKMNQAIMEKNWIHIQDGTHYNDQYDLTITTQHPLNFQLGDTIIFKGHISIDKDFGYGYQYPVLMEDATLLKSL